MPDLRPAAQRSEHFACNLLTSSHAVKSCKRRRDTTAITTRYHSRYQFQFMNQTSIEDDVPRTIPWEVVKVNITEVRVPGLAPQYRSDGYSQAGALPHMAAQVSRKKKSDEIYPARANVTVTVGNCPFSPCQEGVAGISRTLRSRLEQATPSPRRNSGPSAQHLPCSLPATGRLPSGLLHPLTKALPAEFFS